MYTIKNYIKLLGALFLTSGAVLLNSCAPVTPAPAKQIDPRLIGTWAAKTQKGTVVLGLSSTGRGKLFLRENKEFLKGNMKWTTRSNILEMKRFGSVQRGNIVKIRENKFVMRDLKNPRYFDHYYRYSPRPLSDPYPIYAWMDNGHYRAIDKPKN